MLKKIWPRVKTAVGVIFQEAVAAAFAALGAEAAVKAGKATDVEEVLAKGVAPSMAAIAATGTTGAVLDCIAIVQEARKKDPNKAAIATAVLAATSKSTGAAGAICALIGFSAATKLFKTAFSAGVAANALKAEKAIENKRYFEAAIAALQTAIAAYNAVEGVPGIETGNSLAMYIAAGLEAASGLLTIVDAVRVGCLSREVTDLAINTGPESITPLLAAQRGCLGAV